MAAAPSKITGCSFFSTKRDQEIIEKIEELVKKGNVKEVLVGLEEITVVYEGCRPAEYAWKEKFPRYSIHFDVLTEETDNAEPSKAMTVGPFFIVARIEGKCYCITASHGFIKVGEATEFVAQRGLRFDGTVKQLVDKDQNGIKLDIAVVEADDELTNLVNASIKRNGIDNVKMKVCDKPLLDLLENQVRREDGETPGIIKYIGFRIVNGKLSSKNFIVIQPEDVKQSFAVNGDSGSAVYLNSDPSSRIFVGMVISEYTREFKEKNMSTSTQKVVVQTAGLVLQTLREQFQAEVTMIDPSYIQEYQIACKKEERRHKPGLLELKMPAVAFTQAIKDDIRTTLLLDKYQMTWGDVEKTAEYIIEKIEQGGFKEEVRLFHGQVSPAEENLKKVKKLIKTIQPSDKSKLLEKFSNALHFTIRDGEMFRNGDNQWSRLIVLWGLPDADMSQVAKDVKFMVQSKVMINAQIHFLFFDDEPKAPTKTPRKQITSQGPTGTPRKQITSQRTATLEHCREMATLTGGSTILLRNDEEGTCQDKVDSWFERTWGLYSGPQKHPSLKAGHTQSSSDPNGDKPYPMTERQHIRK